MNGSHHIFARLDVEEILNLQPKDAQAKPYQTKRDKKLDQAEAHYTNAELGAVLFTTFGTLAIWKWVDDPAYPTKSAWLPTIDQEGTIGIAFAINW